jgi:hypothetical protein
MPFVSAPDFGKTEIEYARLYVVIISLTTYLEKLTWAMAGAIPHSPGSASKSLREFPLVEMITVAAR